MNNLASACEQIASNKSAVMAQRVEAGVANNSNALKAVTPRWVAHSLGLNLGDVIACFKRQEGLGRLESFSGADGEIFYRQVKH